MNHINGKVIIITGAASGFGKLIAGKAAEQGAKIVASDVNEDVLGETVEEIKAAGGDALAVAADVTNLEDMKALVSAAVTAYGSAQVLINNAGIMPLAFFADHKEAAGAWDKCIDINLKGALNGITAAYDQMIEQGQGHIVNIASIYANHSVQGAAVYGATKAALIYLSEALRQEAHGAIKVTTVRPTGVPATGIANAVINFDAAAGILGASGAVYGERMAKMMAGEGAPQWSDPDHVDYSPLAPEYIADEVLHAINQPWGVCIGDVTVRASGDMYAL